MKTLTLWLSVLLLSAAGCSKGAPCEELAAKLCSTASEHCAQARPWIDSQGAGDESARDAVCAAVMGSPDAVQTYVSRFASAMSPEPVPVPAAVTARPIAAPAPAKAKAGTKDKIREAGETLEEIGNTGEKAGEAIDKIKGALNPDPK